uniref:Transposase n=1 Tax=Ascaris lumbricoides TaxID=6252 RepID=A0A0M3HXU2_ASCLU
MDEQLVRQLLYPRSRYIARGEFMKIAAHVCNQLLRDEHQTKTAFVRGCQKKGASDFSRLQSAGSECRRVCFGVVRQ